jgi:hypothetical protein
VAGERDELILDHIRRYHLTTDEVLRTLFFPETSTNAVRKVTGRLVRERSIKPYTLYEARKYYVLSPRMAEELGEHRCIARAFNYQGLVNAYGVLCFCAAFGITKFTAREFIERFPELHARGRRASNYYLDNSDDVKRLALIEVDSGKSPERIHRRVQKLITRAYELQGFGPIISRGRFLITIVTPSDGKRANIEEVLRDEPSDAVKFRLEVVPELGRLLINHPRRTTPEREQVEGEVEGA